MNVFRNLAELWNKLTTSQKSALGVAVLLLAIGVMVVVQLFGHSGPRYTLLYGNLADEDAALVVQKLKEVKVKYRITGNSIEVPPDQVDELRLSLASEGIPSSGSVGFELFDRTNIGQSEFGERMSYLRALQGELQRTIAKLRSVKSARVHLALPERRLYSLEDRKPSASVVLDLQGGSPSASEIKSVIHLVSSAVEGLDPQAVTVVDTSGTLLSDMPNLASDDKGTARLQAQRVMETQIEQRVQSMLDRVLGPEKSIVRATVALDFDRKHIEREVYSPAGNGNTGVLESQNTSSEHYAGSSGRTTAGGTVGVTANTTPPAGTRPGGNGEYNRTDDKSLYRISKQVESTEVTPGSVQRITLALFVDKSVKQEQISELENTLIAAAGMNTTRGDLIEVQQAPFDNSVAKAEEAAEKAASRSAMLTTLVKYGVGGLLIAAFLVLLFIIYKSTLAPVTAGMLAQEDARALDYLPKSDGLPDDYPVLGAGEPLLDYSMLGAPAMADGPLGLDLAPLGEPLMATAEEGPSLANMDPERLARVIKGLLSEEKS